MWYPIRLVTCEEKKLGLVGGRTNPSRRCADLHLQLTICAHVMKSPSSFPGSARQSRAGGHSPAADATIIARLPTRAHHPSLTHSRSPAPGRVFRVHRFCCAVSSLPSSARFPFLFRRKTQRNASRPTATTSPPLPPAAPREIPAMPLPPALSPGAAP
jgi:hypothetical protein